MLKSLAKDTAVYGLTDFIFRFINFAIFPILSFVLTVGEFGAYALLTTLALLVATVFNCGLNRALERFYLDGEQTAEKRSAVVSMGLFCEALFALLVIGPAIGLVYYYREGLEIGWVAFAIALGGCLPTQLFNLSLNGLRLNFLPWHFTSLNIIQNAISLSLSLYFVVGLGWGVLGFLSGMAIGYSLVAPVAIGLLFRRASWVWDWGLAKEMLQFGYPFVFVDVARWIFTSMDRWLLAEYADLTEVGLYSMAFKLSTVLIFLIGAFSLAWTPQALKAYVEDPGHRRLYSRCLTAWFFGLTFVAMAVHLLGPECLMLLTPPAYWPSAHLLPWVSTGLALFGTTYVTMISMMITKKTHHLTWMAWGSAGLNLLLNLWWIPFWGAQGSAAATLVTYAVLSTYYLVVAQRLYPIPLEWGKLALCLGLLLGSACVSIGLNQKIWAYSLLLPKVGVLTAVLLAGIAVLIPGSKKAIPVN